MKLLPTFLFTVLAGGVVLAAPPQIHRADRYKDLYLNSAITDPPLKVEEEAEINDLPDWVLVGVSKYVGRVEVEIKNIKDRTRVRIPGKDATEMGFAIKEIQQGGNYIDDTVVVLKKGNNVGEVHFDAKYLVLKKVAGPSVAKGNTQGKTDPNKGRTSKDKKPPTPGSRPGGSSGSPSKTPPRPGTTTSNVPRPTTAATKTQSSGSTSSKRSRWIKPTK